MPEYVSVTVTESDLGWLLTEAWSACERYERSGWGSAQGSRDILADIARQVGWSQLADSVSTTAVVFHDAAGA